LSWGERASMGVLPAVRLSSLRLQMHLALARGRIDRHGHVGMKEFPLAADLVKDVGNAKRSLLRRPVLVLPGEVLQAAGGPQSVVSDDLELNEFPLQLFGLLEDGV